MSYIIPENLKYTRTHEWINQDEDKYRVGVTDFAVKHLGDITYIDFPEVDSELEKGDIECAIETVKSSEDIENFITGTVSGNNELILADSPETVTADCYGDGWLYEVTTQDESDFDELMTPAEYGEYLKEIDG